MNTIHRSLFSGSRRASSGVRVLIASLVAAAGVLTLAPIGSGLVPASAASLREPAKTAEQRIKIKLKDGRSVEGVLLEETREFVRVRVKSAIGNVETKYFLSEIESVEKLVSTPATGTEPKSDGGKKDEPKKDEVKKDDTKSATIAGAASGGSVNKLDQFEPKLSNNPDDPSAKVIYRINIRGDVGEAVSATPLRKIVADASKHQPDILLLYIDSRWDWYQNNARSPLQEAAAFDKVDRVTEISEILIDEVRDNPKWGKKPEIVTWVKNAYGPAAFIPFVANRIYYAPDATHGGMGYIDFLFQGRGDYVVREKQISLRMGRAEGLAVKGGHDFRVLRAMARFDYTLSYTMVGGKPEFHEDLTGDTILTDDGNAEAGRGDTMEDSVRGKGNDVLNLNAETGQRIGFIDGVAGTFDDLMFELGVSRAYKTFGLRGDRITADWSREIGRVLPELRDLQDKLGDTRVVGETPEDRNRARARQKSIINQMIGIVQKYKEVAGDIVGDPDDFIDAQRARLAQIDLEIRMDRPRR